MAPHPIASKARAVPSGSLSNIAPGRALSVLRDTALYVRDPLAFILGKARDHGDVAPVHILGLDVFLVSDPRDIERVLVTEHRKVVKDRYTQDLSRLLGQGLLTSDGDHWRRQRRLAQPAFHRDRIAHYAEMMVEAAEQHIANWRPGMVLDVHDEMMQLTRDIVCRTLFGSQPSPEMAAVNRALEDTMDRFAEPVFAIFPFLEKMPLPLSIRYRRAVRTLDTIVYGLIRKRRAEARDTGDLLSMLLAARDEDGSHMSDQQVRDEIMTIFLAGHETTAIALSWTFYLLSLHPEACAALGDEVRRVLGDGSASLRHLPELRMTDNVASESMRLYPPAWALGREVVEPFELRGRMIPKGTQLWLSPWVVHRDPRLFQDPLAFRPSRWENGFAKSLPKFGYFPFGGGPRLCIGNNFALTEIALVLATIAKKFKLALVPGQKIVPFPSVTLRPKHGIRFRLETRFE